MMPQPTAAALLCISGCGWLRWIKQANGRLSDVIIPVRSGYGPTLLYNCPKPLHTMTDAKRLKEMEDALKEVNECAEALEQLLKEARGTGGATPEIFERIREANRHCEEAMQRYTAYYDAISG